MNAGRILVVDDDESTRTLLNDYLVDLGYEVITAVDGEDAQGKFVPGTFDCVISDLLMPRVDGLELLKIIKEKDKKVLFMMITGYPSIDGAVDAIREGAYDYVIKPLHMEDIRIKVERAMGAIRMAGSLRTMKGLFWGIVLSVPIWLILGAIVGFIWK
jgi:two-component system response regulator PilR (NtrC family)